MQNFSTAPKKLGADISRPVWPPKPTVYASYLVSLSFPCAALTALKSAQSERNESFLAGSDNFRCVRSAIEFEAWLVEQHCPSFPISNLSSSHTSQIGRYLNNIQKRKWLAHGVTTTFWVPVWNSWWCHTLTLYCMTSLALNYIHLRRNMMLTWPSGRSFGWFRVQHRLQNIIFWAGQGAPQVDLPRRHFHLPRHSVKQRWDWILLKTLLAERGKSGSCSACPIDTFCRIHLQLATGPVVMLHAVISYFLVPTKR